MVSQSWPSPAQPSDEEDRILNSAIRHARLVGLAFGPRAVEIRWTRDGLGYPGSQCDGITYIRERPVRIYLRCGLAPDCLFRVVLHELLHAHDAIRYGNMVNREQDEVRAEVFVEFAMHALARGEQPGLPLAQWTDLLDRVL